MQIIDLGLTLEDSEIFPGVEPENINKELDIIVHDEGDTEDEPNFNSGEEDKKVDDVEEEEIKRQQQNCIQSLEEMECVDETINDVIIDTNPPINLDVTLGQLESNTALLNDDIILK